METEEIWKDIEGYEGVYRVSNKGNVLTVRKNRVLKPEITKDGYARVQLSLKGQSKMYIHRLVAQAFLANPDSLPEVNHIDEAKLNNCVDNVEWCTREYNNNYRTDASKPRGRGNGRSVIGTHKVTGEKIYFDGPASVLDAGFPNIRAVVGKYGKKGKRRTRYGYIWDYAPDRDQ